MYFWKKKLHPKTVAFLCTSLNNMAGGLERQIIRTATAVSDNGYKVYIITFDSDGDSSFYNIPYNITWLRCGCNLTPHKSASLFQRLSQLLYLRKVLLRSKSSCLITFHHGLYLRVLIATLFTGIKNIVSERNSLKFYNYIKQQKYNLAFILSFMADARTVQVQAYVSEYPRFTRKKISVIPNILPCKPILDFKTPNLESRKICLLGRIEAQKNFGVLLDQMLENISSLEFSVELAGEGSLGDVYKKKYAQLVDKGFLTFRGNVSDVFTLLRSCTALCLPSLWEGFPNALLEAIYCGLPIVTSPRMSDLTDFIEHDVNGLVTADDKLLDSIEHILSDKQKLKIFSNESFNKYQQLSKNDPVNSWLHLIASTIK